jgi:hypothetical protein
VKTRISNSTNKQSNVTVAWAVDRVRDLRRACNPRRRWWDSAADRTRNWRDNRECSGASSAAAARSADRRRARAADTAPAPPTSRQTPLADNASSVAPQTPRPGAPGSSRTSALFADDYNTRRLTAHSPAQPLDNLLPIQWSVVWQSRADCIAIIDVCKIGAKIEKFRRQRSADKKSL